MLGSGTNRAFLAGLAGGILGALLLATVPMVSAAVGEAVNLGEVNKANAITSIRGTSDVTLRLNNQQADAPALDLRVTDGSAPFKVNSSAKVAHLNADKLDGRSANGLVRVAHASTDEHTQEDGIVTSASINAPTRGLLVINASAYVAADEWTAVACRLGITSGGLVDTSGWREVVLESQDNSYDRDTCITSAVVPVDSGVHSVGLEIFGLVPAEVRAADIWALFVPFDGTGSIP